MDLDCFVDITRQELCRRIGYTADVEPSPRIASIVDESLANARYLIDPSYAYVILDVNGVEGEVAHLGDSITFRSKVISGLLKNCSMAAVFVLTIGPKIEKLAVKLADDGMILESYVLDAIGSSAAEKTADLVQGIIGEIAHLQGLSISRRFSPGYCDWPITEQEILFRAIDGNSTGVSLSEGCLMTPQKSVSGIIGMGRDSCSLSSYNPCRTCEKRNCIGRR